jgi:hypothetical protein
MSEPALEQDSQVLQPVQAGAREPTGEVWAARLVVFLRIMAVVSLLKGLYYWAIVCGVGAPSPAGFDSYTLPYQSATVFFAVIDLVASVGLWLAAPWGAVVWLTSVISMAAVEALFPQVYGGRLWVIVIELVLLGAYLSLALLSAREHAP